MPEYGESLTEREKEVLRLVATGITNREIAYQLSISVNTVKVHLRNTYTKLGAESRTEATMIAVREGWVPVEGMEGSASGEAAVAPSPPPAPPLPWPRRAALIAVLLLVVATVGVTWPRTRPQAGAEPGLPLEQSRAQPVTARVGEDVESPWREQAQMPTRRARLAVAVVEGRILAIGGQTPEGITGAVEAYDPEDDTWAPAKEKPRPAAYVEAAVVGTDVYVPGGCDLDGTPTRVVEMYDAEADSWREVSPLPEPRCAYALAAWEGKLYLFGGWDGERYVATVYVYDPQADSWVEEAPMSSARGLAGAAPLGGRLYVVGGYDGERQLATCAVYEPAAGSWGSCPPLAVGRAGLGLVALGGQLYAVGGGGGSSYLGFNERYNPSGDAWGAFETPLIEEWRELGVVVFDSTIYAIGGWNGDYLSLTQAYELLPFRIFIPVSHQR